MKVEFNFNRCDNVTVSKCGRFTLSRESDERGDCWWVLRDGERTSYFKTRLAAVECANERAK